MQNMYQKWLADEELEGFENQSSEQTSGYRGTPALVTGEPNGLPGYSSYAEADPRENEKKRSLTKGNEMARISEEDEGDNNQFANDEPPALAPLRMLDGNHGRSLCPNATVVIRRVC